MARVYLTVPGVTNSSENHWQSRWEREFPEKFRRIEQDEWDTPVCGDWIAKIESDVQAKGPEKCYSHRSQPRLRGCRSMGGKIWNADRRCIACRTERCRGRNVYVRHERLCTDPLEPLPFRSIVVASTNDEYVSFGRAKFFADAWSSGFVDVGEKGHINPGSGFGKWDEGLELLKRLD